jgi:hypothetical protein
MPRRLVIVNALLAMIALVAIGYIYREVRRTPAPPSPRRTAAANTPQSTGAVAPEPPGSYAVVTSRNLFSPTRSEAPAAAVSTAPPQPKPNLFGIVLRDGAPVAYLEDPTTKRVAGYRLGDTVAGGTVARIGADHVVLNRPDGDVNVRLRDPSKPKPAAPAPVAGQPGQPVGVVPGAPGIAAAPPSAQPLPSGAQPATAPAPGPTIPQGPGFVPGQITPRRPLPPNLLRRLPPQVPQPSDAPAQN